jgi:hypothetical protein
LDEHDAQAGELANRRLHPRESALLGDGPVLLTTRLGPRDCLGTLMRGRRFEELASHGESIEDVGGNSLVVSLPTLIELKTSTGRAKDRAMLLVLIARCARRAPETLGRNSRGECGGGGRKQNVVLLKPDGVLRTITRRCIRAFSSGVRLHEVRSRSRDRLASIR